MMRRLATAENDFDARLAELLVFEAAQDPNVDDAVAGILADVKLRGDTALLEYTRRFDRVDVHAAGDLHISAAVCERALATLPEAQRAALTTAAERVRAYHEHQRVQSWSYHDAEGNELGQRITALDRVGVYVPGGKAAYPSSVIMNVVPAKVAGVREIVMAVPTPGGERSALVLAAAALCGVDRVYTMGGAQAIGAMAFGTQTIAAVDKIVGPGNAYVAAAKRRVFGVVGIDMIAGPSEIVVVSDGASDPDWIAMDLFSQAEHDELAQAILISPTRTFLDAVKVSIERQLPQMPRRKVIADALARRGALIEVRDLDEACEIVNRIAPEHLELSVEDPEPLLPKIRHAGAIFLGRYASEALGDYCAGPNHVLPTSRTARFSSPLGVYDFQKRSSVIRISREGAAKLGKIAAELAHGEGLTAHARSAEYRMGRR
jgi:histidinol dehydrogenase